MAGVGVQFNFQYCHTNTASSLRPTPEAELAFKNCFKRIKSGEENVVYIINVSGKRFFAKNIFFSITDF